MRIVGSGISGLIGGQLRDKLRADGHEILQLVRGPAGEGTRQWDPNAGKLDPSAFDGADAVIHLSGENVAGRRWTPEMKKRIHDSRIKSTSLIASTLAGLYMPPRTWLCASAIGFYGDRGNESVDESSPPGTGFLVDVCREWEEATRPAVDRGVRVVNLRLGVVLSPEGGALKMMLTPFRLGLGGVVGSGNQWFSWIAIDDAVSAIEFCLTNETLAGPVNIVAPNPVTNRDFTKALGKALHRPTILPTPAFALRLIFGKEMANEFFLASTRVLPTRLQAAGFQFRFLDTDSTLPHLTKAQPESQSE